MKKIFKFTAILMAILLFGIVILLSYVKTMLPNVGAAPEITVEATAARIDRGDYLVNNVMACLDCHSTRDWSRFAAPVKPGTTGVGGEVFGREMGFPGKYVSSNLTPANLGQWTDGELFRAITTGVSKDGHALFPIMPYLNYGQLDEEDIKSVIAYLRTLKPIESNPEPSESDFPINFIINTIPTKANFQPRPPKSDQVNYGKYLVTAASCGECHTNQVDGKVVGAPFAGGMEFPFPNGDMCRSLNITPHSTGIGDWTEQQFVDRFKYYSEPEYIHQKAAKGKFQTIMPWLIYRGMTDEDLKAIYAYLQTLEPVDNRVERFLAGS